MATLQISTQNFASAIARLKELGERRAGGHTPGSAGGGARSLSEK